MGNSNNPKFLTRSKFQFFGSKQQVKQRNITKVDIYINKLKEGISNLEKNKDTWSDQEKTTSLERLLNDRDLLIKFTDVTPSQKIQIEYIVDKIDQLAKSGIFFK